MQNGQGSDHEDQSGITNQDDSQGYMRLAECYANVKSKNASYIHPSLNVPPLRIHRRMNVSAIMNKRKENETAKDNTTIDPTTDPNPNIYANFTANQTVSENYNSIQTNTTNNIPTQLGSANYASNLITPTWCNQSQAASDYYNSKQSVVPIYTSNQTASVSYAPTQNTPMNYNSNPSETMSCISNQALLANYNQNIPNNKNFSVNQLFPVSYNSDQSIASSYNPSSLYPINPNQNIYNPKSQTFNPTEPFNLDSYTNSYTDGQMYQNVNSYPQMYGYNSNDASFTNMQNMYDLSNRMYAQSLQARTRVESYQNSCNGYYTHPGDQLQAKQYYPYISDGVQKMNQTTNHLNNLKMALNTSESNNSRRRSSCTKANGNRRNRMTYSKDQLESLEVEFLRGAFIHRVRRTELGRAIHLTDRQVKIWFQNRRMKDKKEQQKPGSFFSEVHSEE